VNKASRSSSLNAMIDANGLVGGSPLAPEGFDVFGSLARVSMAGTKSLAG